jgi:dTDP-3-amino-3,4,6-trideoxy-alpha-D-glucose transaminase
VRVRFLDLTPEPVLRSELDGALRRVTASGRYLLGVELEAFETEFAAYVGARHCVGVGSGLDALRLSLQARGIGPGDEVLVPGTTFVATWMAVSATGAVPVGVDVDPHLHLIDPALIEAAITARTAAIVPVDLYGHPADHVALRALADRHGLWLLDDAAQAHGARLHDRHASSWADAAAWSFYPGKNLGALGDGGAVTTDDELLARRLRRLRNYGCEGKYHHVEQGSNSRLDELQAAVLQIKLRRLDATNARRSEIAVRYQSGLARAGLELPHVRPGAEPSWHLFVVRTPQRDALRAHLERAGIETLVHYPVPPHRQPAYAGTSADRVQLPVSDRVATEVLSLPIGPHLDDRAVDEVIAAVVAFGARRTTGVAA